MDCFYVFLQLLVVYHLKDSFDSRALMCGRHAISRLCLHSECMSFRCWIDALDLGAVAS